jgi:hypothetical protein
VGTTKVKETEEEAKTESKRKCKTRFVSVAPKREERKKKNCSNVDRNILCGGWRRKKNWKRERVGTAELKSHKEEASKHKWDRNKEKKVSGQQDTQ